MRGRALVYAGLCRMEKHANVAAVLYERAVLCLNDVAAKCPGVLLDALRVWCLPEGSPVISRERRPLPAITRRRAATWMISMKRAMIPLLTLPSSK